MASRPAAVMIVLAAMVSAAPAEPLRPVDGFSLVPDLPAEDRNPWPAAWEEAFRRRLRDWLDREEHKPPAATWVYEKSGGGFLAFLKGHGEAALAAMRIQPGGCRHTNGIDFYWCFHLEKQPRYYFQFGRFQPPAFLAKMKEGARLWTAEDPRPNLELALQLDCPDAEVAAHARRQLGAMWRTREQVVEMIARARGETKGGQPANKLRFADYLEGVLPRWPATMPADPAGWRAWWKLIADGDWMIYEEYERRTNPRPHPVHGIGAGPVGASWGPEVRGGWVDWRNTDNLRAMREVAVYLFAEETGNDLVRKVYRERIRRSARAFLSIGNGEWDSPAYVGLTIAAYQGLYDFARDRDARLLAKGILDYLVTSQAVKYFRAGACGSNTRDYGTWSPGGGGGGSRTISTWLPDPAWPVPDDLATFCFLSAYRPPAAVIALAKKEVPLPCEILATHPTYSNWLPGADAEPACHETQYLSREFQIGTRIEGGSYDGNGGKILLAHPKRGCDYLIPAAKAKGNPCIGGNDRIAQCRNAVIWLNGARAGAKGGFGATPWRVLIPGDAKVERVGGVTFLCCASSWVAIRPVRCALGEPDPKGIAAFMKKGEGVRDSSGNVLPAGAAPKVLPGTGDGSRITGLAIEVADGLHFTDYEAFKAATLAKAKLALAGERVSFSAASGARVAIAWDGEAKLPRVERDGKAHDWRQHRAMWQAGSTGPSPVTLGWKEGRLTVQAGGHRFVGTMDLAKGAYRFTNAAVQLPR